MKLGFDIDGIVADMGQSLLNHINEKYELNHTIDVFHHHNLFNNEYVDDSELNKEIAQSMVDNVIHDEDGLLAVKPQEGALVALAKLWRHHNIYFITARRAESHKVTVKWMRKHSINFDTVYCTGASKPGDSSKGMLGRSLNLDFYVDDQDKHLDAMFKFKARWRKPMVLMTRPWNVWQPLDNRFVRLGSWEEIIRHLGIHKR